MNEKLIKIKEKIKKVLKKIKESKQAKAIIKQIKKVIAFLKDKYDDVQLAFYRRKKFGKPLKIEFPIYMIKGALSPIINGALKGLKKFKKERAR